MRELLRFVLVGLAATLTHVAVAWVALSAGGLGAVAANAVAFVVATGVSYAGNTRWSFAARPDRRNATRFALVSGAALLLTMAVAGAVQAAGGSPALGIGAVVTLVPAATFVAHRSFTYRR